MSSAVPTTIFYSWQSDLPNRTNRTFIQDALQKAIDGVLEAELEIDLVLDRDTKDTPGAPDISKTILDKIDGAAVVVADVSIVTCHDQWEANTKPKCSLRAWIRSTSAVLALRSASVEPRDGTNRRAPV